MRLTGKDAAATVLAGLAALVVLAVTRGWGWPLLGSPRAGTLALGVVGWGMCVTGSRIDKQTSMRDPFIGLAIVLGAVALILIVVGLVAASQQAFVALGVTLVALWAVSTFRHVAQAPRRPASAH